MSILSTAKQYSLPIAISLVLCGIAYANFSGTEDSVPTLDELIQERRASLLEEQMEVDRDNLKALASCRKSQEKTEKATQALDNINVCYNKLKRADIDIEKEMAKFST